jgi:hypothetical protein
MTALSPTLPQIAHSSPSRSNPPYRSANFNGLLGWLALPGSQREDMPAQGWGAILP